LILIVKIQTLVASVVFALAMATGAHAATVTYINADPTPVMQLTVDDNDGSGVFTFSFETTAGTADYLALGFNLGGLPLVEDDIVLVRATNASNYPISPMLTLYGDGSASQSDCEQGCNFNGSGSETLFDYIIKFASQGGNTDNYVKTVQFTITLAEATLESFTQFGVRAQSTSNDGGSIKADLTPSPVPLPAGLPLLLSGLLAAGLLVRRRTV